MPTVRRFVRISYKVSGSKRFTMSNDKLWQRSHQSFYSQNRDVVFDWLDEVFQ